MKAIQVYNKFKELQAKIDPIPHVAWTFFFDAPREIEVFGGTITVGHDFKTLEEARSAVEYFVDQLGGKVEWKP